MIEDMLYVASLMNFSTVERRDQNENYIIEILNNDEEVVGRISHKNQGVTWDMSQDFAQEVEIYQEARAIAR